MPASDYFTISGGGVVTEEYIDISYVSFRLSGTGNISFNQNLTTYFTVIGGGGGGGGGGHDNGSGSPAYPSGGGGGAGACGKISLKTGNNINYPYVAGNGGGAGSGNNNGVNGDDSSITFSLTDYILAPGGYYGGGHYGGNGGGLGGVLTIQGLDTIISGTSGDGGHGVKIGNIGPDPSGNGIAGTNSTPISIENYPNNFINVGGGGGGADAHDTTLPPPNPYKGGGGGDGVGGVVGSGVSSGTEYNGQPGIVPGAGGGGGGQPGTGAPATFGYPITAGGVGEGGAIFVYIVLDNLKNSCEWNPELANETVEWTRGHTDCVDLSGATLNTQPMTRQDLSEKRKATIFQYKNNSAGFSKKQQYSRLARGIGRQRGQSFATQSDTYTNPNTHNLKIENNTVLECPAGVAKNWALTNQNDTPGPLRKISNYPTVPLTNYMVRRTYLAGNNKWPQLGPFNPNSSSSSSSSSLYVPMVVIQSPSNDSTIYNNSIEIDYITYNFYPGFYIKVLVNNQVQSDKTIYISSLLSSSSSVVINNMEANNYNITLQTYNNNDIPFPATDQRMVYILVPTVKITSPSTSTSTNDTIYNNTFEIEYNSTNLGDNKIVLYQGNTILDNNVTDNPYQVTGLIDGSYTFKLQIDNDDLSPNPTIESEVIITIAIPTVTITSTSPNDAITTSSFEIAYDVTNIPSTYKLALYQTILGETIWITYCDTETGPNTVPILPPSNGDYTYTLKILNASSEPTPTDNEATISVTFNIPTLYLTGATEPTTVIDDYTYIYFKSTTTPGNFTLKYGQTTMNILLVGGGGCGGFDGGYWGSGGGGAGAYVTGDINPTTNVQYNITIGDGGYGNQVAGNGYNSSIKTETGTVTTVVEAYGGGRGGDNPGTVNEGQGDTGIGSGGGGSGDGTGGATNDPAGGQAPGAPGTPAGLGGTVYASQGGYGWTANSSTNDWNNYPRRGGGGGGGAGGMGGNAPEGWIGGNGGNGKQWLDDVWYSGGGAGQGVDDRNNENYGGNGGGGNGGQSGVSNTGGGGGAGQGSNPGSGGSGICVIRLLTSSFIIG